MKNAFPILATCVFAIFLGSCGRLERAPEKVSSAAIAPVREGVLPGVSQGVRERFGAGTSGFHLIKGGEEALNLRLALVDHARETIDIQYYLWDPDEAGKLLFSRILDAADRGVRVRLLVDDFLYGGDEKWLAAVSHHPNLEIRIFNPWHVREGKLRSGMEFLFNFTELNRRMHNKLFVVDNRVAIMGGRNVGNAYYGMSEKYNFLDLDVITAGPVVDDISQGFDEYWNSDPAYPGEKMAPDVGPEMSAPAIAEFRREFAENPGVLPETNFSMKRKNWGAELASLKLKWHPGTATMLQDAPVTKRGVPRHRFLDGAEEFIEENEPEEWIFVSPYLIPRLTFYGILKEHAARGGRVTFLVPGLDSTNQPMVHSHYKKHRRALLRHGAELHELKKEPSSEIRGLADVHPVKSKRVALHLKGAVSDRKRCFIGSLNLDPRAIVHNTENGLLIDSPDLSIELAEHFEMVMSEENSWRVTTKRDKGRGAIRWESGGKVKSAQPAPNFKARASDFFFGFLPIKGML